MCCLAKKRSNKLKGCGICSFIGGGFLLVFGISFPLILNYLVGEVAKDSAALK